MRISGLIPFSGARLDLLLDSLRSLVNQSMPPEEIVVVLNGPDVGAGEEISKWKEFHHRLVVLDAGEPGSVARALNTGARAASGEFLVRLDAGDISCPDRVEAQMREAERTVADVVYSDIEIRAARNRLVRLRGAVPNEQTASHLLVSNCIPHPSVLLRRSSLLSAGAYSEQCAIEDYELWLRMAAKWRFSSVQRPLVRYLYTPNSQTRKIRTLTPPDLITSLCSAWKTVAGIELPAFVAEVLLAPLSIKRLASPERREVYLSASDALAQLVDLKKGQATKEVRGLRQRVAVTMLELVAAAPRETARPFIRWLTVTPPRMSAVVGKVALQAAVLKVQRNRAPAFGETAGHP